MTRPQPRPQPRPERIFHIATRADWVKAVGSGSYTTSTIGRTLEDEGFIHASRFEQVADVFARHYRGVGEPLVLLTIAPERLEAEVREETVGPENPETFPHIYGPLTRGAVLEAVPLDRRGRRQTLAGVFLQEMAKRMGIALLVMALIVAVVVTLQQL